ncbi:MAG TPA: hypothetical protein VN633_07510 [Bryobacteraceae bacterium]|nr:hypothetical protein [Bryobacteraceae bacterium]
MSCTRAPQDLKLEEYIHSRNLPAEAPLIIVGTIISNDQVGHEVLGHFKSDKQRYSEKTHRYEHLDYSLQLFKVKIQIENVLRGGELKQKQMGVYYYTHVGPFGMPLIGMHGYGGTWEIGDREIFYLKKIDNVFRTACDFNRSCVTPVFSGAHPGFTIDSSRPPTESIIDLLLTRGQGSTDQGMVKAVLSRSAEYFNEPYAIRKWQEIAEHDESAAVRDAACSQLKKEESPCPSYRGTSARKQGS